MLKVVDSVIISYVISLEFSHNRDYNPFLVSKKVFTFSIGVFMSHLLKIFLFLVSSFVLVSCATDNVVYEYPVPPDVRRDANMGSILTGDKDSGVYLFQSGRKDGAAEKIGPNKVLWQAALDDLSSMPITTSDYAGGMIATDWYSKPGDNTKRSKVNVVIKGSRLAAANLKVTIFRQHLIGGVWTAVSVNPSENAQKEMDILNRARQVVSK